MTILGYLGKARVSTKNLLSLPVNVVENYKINKGDTVKFFSEEGYMALDDKDIQKEFEAKRIVVIHVIVERKQEDRKNGK